MMEARNYITEFKRRACSTYGCHTRTLLASAVSSDRINMAAGCLRHELLECRWPVGLRAMEWWKSGLISNASQLSQAYLASSRAKSGL
jgi:hypothetical protein